MNSETTEVELQKAVKIKRIKKKFNQNYYDSKKKSSTVLSNIPQPPDQNPTESVAKLETNTVPQQDKNTHSVVVSVKQFVENSELDELTVNLTLLRIGKFEIYFFYKFLKILTRNYSVK